VYYSIVTTIVETTNEGMTITSHADRNDRTKTTGYRGSMSLHTRFTICSIDGRNVRGAQRASLVRGSAGTFDHP
jgi:hypothetical protein